MIYRTATEALRERPPFASWKTKCIVRVDLKDGRTFFRTYEFDESQDKCRACRNASRAGRNRGLRSKLASTGHTCEQCGNPYAGFVRRYATNRNGAWEVYPDSWCSSGRLH
jgi:hypothetical protein